MAAAILIASAHKVAMIAKRSRPLQNIQSGNFLLNLGRSTVDRKQI